MTGSAQCLPPAYFGAVFRLPFRRLWQALSVQLRSPQSALYTELSWGGAMTALATVPKP